MRLTPKEKLTLKYYEIHGQEWSKIAYKKSFWSKEIEKFHKLLPKGKVLEIGSGNGRDAKVLIQLRYHYTGTDISKKLLEIAKKNNPGERFLHKSVYKLNFPKNAFDGFWACATLLHVPKSRIIEALISIQKVVRARSVGFISLKEGEGETIENSTGRYFTYYTKEEFIKYLKSINFTVIGTGRKLDKKSNISWLTFFIRNDKKG